MRREIIDIKLGSLWFIVGGNFASMRYLGADMFLLRHGQSYFNLHFNQSGVDPGIKDPELTPFGIAQAAAAATTLATSRLTRILVSPYTRALQTVEPIRALYDLPVDVLHEVRERAAFTCDVGSTPDVLATRFPQHDFAHLPRQWWHEGTEPLEATIARANNFRSLMSTRTDSDTTLLVSHWAFLLALTGVSLENAEIMEYDPASPAPPKMAPYA